MKPKFSRPINLTPKLLEVVMRGNFRKVPLWKPSEGSVSLWSLSEPSKGKLPLEIVSVFKPELRINLK
jgi:hypothetical protein